MRIPTLLPCIILCFSLFSFARAETVEVQIIENVEGSEMVRYLPVDAPEGTEPLLAAVGRGDYLLDYGGRTVRAKKSVSMGETRLEAIWPQDGFQVRAMEGTNRSLQRTVFQLGRGEHLSRGDYLPDFALFDQNAEILRSRDLLGAPVVMTFIFTRCTVENMCPMTTRRMLSLADEIESRELGPVHHLLVSFDPEYDTPGNLHLHALNNEISSEKIRFLTANQSVIDDLTRAFGIVVMEEDGTLNHNISTILTDNRRRIVLRQDGGRWSKANIIRELERIQTR